MVDSVTPRLQDMPTLMQAAVSQPTAQDRQRARSEALRGLVGLFVKGELYPRAAAYDINELITQAGMFDGQAGRSQTLAEVREFLAGMSGAQLRALLLETRAESQLQILIREVIDQQQGLVPTWGQPQLPQSENPATRVTPPAPETTELTTGEVPPGTTFRSGVNVEAEATRATNFLLGRGGDAATLTDLFYGTTKADQAALARRIGEMLIAESAASRGGRLPINPEQAFMTMVERRLSADEVRLFRALRENPTSRYALHDDIFRSVRGWGVHMPGLVETFSKLTMAQQQELARAYQQRYGESLPDRLFNGFAEVRDGNDRARLRMLQNQVQLGDGDLAYAIYAQTAGRSGVDHRALFQALEAAAGRFGQIDNLYARSLPGQEMIRDVMAKLGGSRESPLWYQRYTALSEGQWDKYLASTARLYLAGAVDTQEMVRVLERYSGEGRVTPERLQAAFASLGGSGDVLQQLRARDPRLAGVLAGPVDGQFASLALELHRSLQGRGTQRGHQVSQLLARIPPDQRAAFFEAYRRINGVSLQDAITAGFTERAPVRGMRSDAEVRWRERLLREANEGPLPALDMLDAFVNRAAEADDVMAAVARMPLEERGTLAARFDQRRGAGAFQNLLDSMESQQRRALQLQLNMGTDDVRNLWTGQRRPDGTWDSASRFLMDRFGFTGDFLDSAVRDFFIESQALARRIEQGEVSVGELARYRRSYERMAQRFSEYDGEKRELASSVGNTAAAVAGITVALASGGSLSPLLLLAGAGTAGVASAAGTAAVMGSDATPEQLASAAFSGAAFEAGGQLVAGTAIRVGGRLVRIVRGTGSAADAAIPGAAQATENLVAASTREQVALTNSVSRMARVAGWHPDDIVDIISNLSQLKRRDAAFLRGVSARLEAGQTVPPADLARAQDLLSKLAVRAPATQRRAVLSAADVANAPELLAGRTPGEVQQLLGLEGTSWRASRTGPWSYEDAATGLHLTWDEGRWTVRTASGTTHTVDAVAPLAYRPSGQVPTQWQRQAQESGLPIIDGGELATQGSRSSYQRFDTTLQGYARFTMPDGRRVFSMAPIEGNAFDALAVLRAFEARTGRTDVMARPIGIHFFNGQPRLIFEDLGATRVGSLADLTAEQQAFVRGLLSQRTYQAIEDRGFNAIAGRYFETDYIFLVDGQVRLGLPVRARTFGQHIDELFRPAGQ